MKSETPVRALVQKGATVSALGLGCMGTSEFYGVRRMVDSMI
jgi:hypothetical protein